MRLERPCMSARSGHAGLTTETDTHAPYYIWACVCLCQGLVRVGLKTHPLAILE